MNRSLFVLPDGTEIFSGIEQVPAIQSVTLTRSVNTETDLQYGASCAAMLEASLIDTSGTFSLASGQELRYYEVDGEGQWRLMGHFLLETPTKPSGHAIKFTAYDRMILLDRDLTDWLTALDQWPYQMADLLSMVCTECGLTLAEDTQLVNGDFPVPRFLSRVTGRQLVQWVAGANGVFAEISPEGTMTFREFSEGGTLRLAQKSIKVTDYATAPIVRVVVQQSEDDVGVACPENSDGETYSILGNPLLASDSSDALFGYVQNLAERLVGVSYTPMELEVFDPDGLCSPGMFLTVEDANGKAYKTAVFSVKHSGGLSVLTSTGNASRANATAVNNKDETKLIQGRVAEIRSTLEEVSAGLRQTTIDMESVKQESSMAALKADSVSTRVSTVQSTAESVKTQLTELTQTASSLELSILNMQEDLDGKADRSTVEEITECFLFAENGMTISNATTGMGIRVSEKQVAFTGGVDPTTVITPNEMTTTNLRVGVRQDLGEFSFLSRTNGNLSFRYTGG